MSSFYRAESGSFRLSDYVLWFDDPTLIGGVFKKVGDSIVYLSSPAINMAALHTSYVGESGSL